MRSTHSRRPGSATISTTRSTKRRLERSISSSSSTRRWASAFSAPRSTRRTSAPSSWRLASSWSSSSWNVTLTFSPLPEAARDVILGALVRRRGEELRGLVVLDEHARAAGVVHLEAEERGPVGHARRLLHVVGNDHDRVVPLEVVHQLLDACRGDRV